MTTTERPAGYQVELYIPNQRADSPLVFMAGAHLDTPVRELLNPANYCRCCGHCMCAVCQAVSTLPAPRDAAS
jgi:hypothetical protein